MSERAVFAPGEAREDWAMLRAVSELAGAKLPFDSYDQLRAAMIKDHSQLGTRRSYKFALVAAEPRSEGVRPDPLSDSRLLPHQRHLPQQPDNAALLGRARADPALRRGGSVIERRPLAVIAAVLNSVALLIYACEAFDPWRCDGRRLRIQGGIPTSFLR